MLRHIVMWKFREGTEEEMDQFLEGLQALNGVIPEILDMEIGVNSLKDEKYDAVLVSTFADLDALNTYKNDPRHVAVSKLCKSIRTDRVAMDFEV